MLKTNSVQGVLVLGSNENGVWCEAEYAITALLNKPQNIYSAQKFSVDLNSSLWGAEDETVLSLLPHRENMHGKGRFAHGKESATLYLSSTCSTARGSHGRPPEDRENIYILIDSFTT